MEGKSAGKVTVRVVGDPCEFDKQVLANLMAEAFGFTQSTYGGLPEDLADPIIAKECVEAILESHSETIRNPSSSSFTRVFVAVDEDTNEPVGFNALEGEGPAVGVGPIAVAKSQMGRGVGRKLMQAVIDSTMPTQNTQFKPFEGVKTVRLVVNTHNSVAQSLYLSLGFETRMHLAVMCGMVKGIGSDKGEKGMKLRRMELKDVDACCKLCEKMTGVSRRHALIRAVEEGVEKEKAGVFTFVPYVVVKEREEEEGKVLAYTLSFNILGHAVAESMEHMTFLLTEVSRKIATFKKEQKGKEETIEEEEERKRYNERIKGTVYGSIEGTPDALPFFFVDMIGYPSLINWCLANSFRLIKTMNLMTIGEYQAVQGIYFPSVEF